MYKDGNRAWRVDCGPEIDIGLQGRLVVASVGLRGTRALRRQSSTGKWFI
uniref:Uncharacterized protein n=1 Tax=Anguilla anguilla TaxID=7936 RepID=A0A0E9PJP5_ANGAN